MKGIEAVRAFREKFGPPSKELLEQVKMTNTLLAAVRKALKDGEKTVPEVSASANVAPEEALWAINAMRKYGEAVVTGDEDGYKKYSLKGTE